MAGKCVKRETRERDGVLAQSTLAEYSQGTDATGTLRPNASREMGRAHRNLGVVR